MTNELTNNLFATDDPNIYVLANFSIKFFYTAHTNTPITCK